MARDEHDANARRILHAPLLPAVLRFGLPLVLAMALHGSFNLVDALFVGNMDSGVDVALAAIGICDAVLMIATIAANGVSTASLALVSRAKGAQDPDELRRAAGQSLVLVTVLSLIFGVIGLVAARPIAAALGAQGDVLDLAASYLRLMFGGIGSIIILLQLTAVLRAVGNSRDPMIVLVVANVLNILVDPILIYGWWGFPQLGLMGAGWATVGARLVGCGMALWLCARAGGLLPRRNELKPDWAMLRRLIRVGLPNSAQLVVRVLAALAFVALIGHAFTTSDDQSATAAIGLGIRLDMVALFMAAGWGAAASTFVGQCLGAGDHRRARHATWLCALLAALTMLPLVYAAQLWSIEIATLFAPSAPAVQQASAEYLRWLSPSYPLAAIGIVLALAMNGAGSTRAPAVLDALAYGLLIVPAAYLMVIGFDHPRTTVWAVIAGGNALLALVYALWFKTGRWRHVSLA